MKRPFFFSLYATLWTLALPLLKKNRRLADGWEQRLIPKNWPDCSHSQKDECFAEVNGQTDFHATLPDSPESALPDVSASTLGGKNVVDGDNFKDGENWAGQDAQPVPLSSGADIWLQAASGGEAYLAVSILKHLAALCPENEDLRILVTTWTRQGLDVLEKECRSIEGRCHILIRFAPLDHPDIVRKAMEQVQPSCMVLLETELWPGLMSACVEQGTPIVVCNGRMSQRTAKQYKRFARFFPRIWGRLTPEAVFAISAQDALRYRAAFPSCRKISVFPNIKFDRALTSSPEDLPFRPGGAICLLASVREEEEDILLPLIQGIRESRPDVLVVIAPRHMHRISAWIEKLDCFGLDPHLASALFSLSPEGNPLIEPGVVIWDRFGELLTLYARAQAAFVGGSLAPLGGQNFLEALSCGCVPCTGPWLGNFEWALQGLSSPSSADSGGTSVFDSAPTADSDSAVTTSAFASSVPAVAATPSVFDSFPSVSSPPDSSGAAEKKCCLTELEEGHIASQCLSEAGLLNICSTVDDVQACLLKQLEMPAQNVREEFLRWLSPRIGSSEKIARILLEYVQKKHDQSINVNPLS